MATAQSNDVYQLPKIASLQGRIRYYATLRRWLDLDGKGKKADAERLAELCEAVRTVITLPNCPYPFFNTSVTMAMALSSISVGKAATTGTQAWT